MPFSCRGIPVSSLALAKRRKTVEFDGRTLPYPCCHSLFNNWRQIGQVFVPARIYCRHHVRPTVNGLRSRYLPIRTCEWAFSGNQSFPVTSRITRMITSSPPGP
jgi:hypothetical protein